MIYLKKFENLFFSKNSDIEIEQTVKEILLPFSDDGFSVKFNIFFDIAHILIYRNKLADTSIYIDDLSHLFSYLKDNDWYLDKFEVSSMDGSHVPLDFTGESGFNYFYKHINFEIKRIKITFNQNKDN